MKKERIFTRLGLAALILAASLSLAGCENLAGNGDGSPIVTERYTTVPVRSLISAKQSVQSSRAVGDSGSYVLASSGIGEDDGIYYYFYYLGYVKNASAGIPAVSEKGFPFRLDAAIAFGWAF